MHVTNIETISDINIEWLIYVSFLSFITFKTWKKRALERTKENLIPCMCIRNMLQQNSTFSANRITWYT